jgi:hypothetical protein
VPPGTDLAQLPDAIQAHLASTNHLNALITVHDYTFKMGRVEIVSVGEGSSECDWQLKNPELQETYTIQFGIVFKVPQGTQSIRLTGMMAVSPKISWLVAQLRDVYDYLSEKLKAILSRPLSERTTAEQLWRSEGETWKLTLPH